MGERYPLCINGHGIENLSYLFENKCLVALDGGETLTAYWFGVNRVLTILSMF